MLLLVSTCSASFANSHFDWLRDDSRKSDRVHSYLVEHNNSTKQYQKGYRHITQSLMQQWDSMSVDQADKPWTITNDQEWYLSQEQGEYRLLKRAGKGEPIEIVYDFSTRQAQYDYYHIGQWRVQNNTLVFTEDIDGSEQYQAIYVNLSSGKTNLLANKVAESVLLSSSMEFAYLIANEPQTQRPYQFIRINTANGNRQVLWQEDKNSWLLSFYSAADTRYAVVQSNNESTTEQRILELDSGHLSYSLREPETGIEYYADIAHGKVFINSNLSGRFSLFQTNYDHRNTAPTKQDWDLFLQLKTNVEQFYLYEAGIAVLNKYNNELTLNVYGYDGKPKASFPLNTNGRTAWLSTLGDFTSNKVRIRSMSMTTPPLWEEIDIKLLQKSLLAQDQYTSFSSQEYVSQRVIVAHQGVEVPVTLAYRKDRLTVNSPVILYGYGAYGFTMKPYFMPQIVSLLDRGVIYAIAHVRGGGYFGAQWHEKGRGVLKMNSMLDFIAAAQNLQQFKGGQREIYALGSSAGGTLVAGAINTKPQLFSGAVLKVPFVDVVASMSDTSLPLTAQQYSEWGDPRIPTELKAMQAYDPLLNIQSAAYPPLLVQIGLHDKRVPYWEGAKYICRSHISE